MSRWKQAIEAACAAVHALPLEFIAKAPTAFRNDVVTQITSAIRSIPEPPTPSEDDVARLTRERNEARTKFCQLEAFRRNGNGGLFVSAYTVSARDVCKSFWPDSADMLFPEVK